MPRPASCWPAAAEVGCRCKGESERNKNTTRWVVFCFWSGRRVFRRSAACGDSPGGGNVAAGDKRGAEDEARRARIKICRWHVFPSVGAGLCSARKTKRATRLARAPFGRPARTRAPQQSPGLLLSLRDCPFRASSSLNSKKERHPFGCLSFLERATRLELATSTLARSRSTR